MDIYLLDWANLLLRWLHVITVIAWIGASFYFVWLDNHLVKPLAADLREKGVDGELWAVHGGGFYNPQKYMVAPPSLPLAETAQGDAPGGGVTLHWFYWESYWTWMSGFALFVVLYLCNASQMLIDPRVHAWGAPWQAWSRRWASSWSAPACMTWPARRWAARVTAASAMTAACWRW